VLAASGGDAFSSFYRLQSAKDFQLPESLGWTEIALTAGWTSPDADNKPRYRIRSSGNLELAGIVRGVCGSSFTNLNDYNNAVPGSKINSAALPWVVNKNIYIAAGGWGLGGNNAIIVVRSGDVFLRGSTNLDAVYDLNSEIRF
ncbi:MAG: hypothetical protein HOP30_09250, partial [Cyclobacteriaceae bacterium]|nr:hypothetical protein [Cyclobacteriaceae bacterium]